MKRLNQLVTRLTIVALIALAMWVGRAWIAKRVLVHHLESYTGAKVDARQLSLNADESTVFLGEVEIADPSVDRQNLLQFDAASLNVDFEQLAGRRVVIEDGRISEIRFGSPRTRTGHLKSSLLKPSRARNGFAGSDLESSAGPPVGKLSRRGESENSAAQRWRNGLLVNLNESDTSENGTFLVIPMLKEKVQLWSDRFRDPALRLSEIEASLSQVEEVLAVPLQQHNPLRSGDQLAEAFEALKASKASLDTVTDEISKFETLSQTDAYELSQAQMKDRQQLLSDGVVQKFDSKLISEMLLGKLQRQLVGDAIERFQQFRNAIPNPSTDFRSVVRGRDLLFGTEAKSRLKIQKLQIDGSTEFANGHFRFAGEIRNIVSNPSSSDLPIEFDLRALGDPQVAASGTIDHRNGKKLESIQLTGHGIEQPAILLGDQQGLVISIASNSRLHVEANLTANELDQISGSVLLNFEDVIMHTDYVHEAAGGQGTAARINETVSAMSSFQIRSTIGGTIGQPKSEFVSELGPTIASSLETVFRDSQQLATQKKERKLSRAVEVELATFKKRVAEGIAELNQTQRVSLKRLNQLQQQLHVAEGPDINRKNELR